MSRASERIARRALAARIDRSQGAPAKIAATRFARFLDAHIHDVSQLPSVVNTTELQDPSTGDFYFIEGYSDVDGGDVIP